MKSYYTESSVFNKLRDKTLFLDTNIFVLLLSYQNFFDNLLEKIREVNCELLTIPSVIFEFSRTDTIEGFNKRKLFLGRITNGVYPIEDDIEEFTDFTVVLQKINGRMSYTDFLLYCCLYNFPKAYLLTENHKDFLTTILDREEVITIDTGKDAIRNIALYSFSSEKYEKAAASIVKATKL